MIRHRLIGAALGAGLLIGGALLAPGCSDDAAQPARESISAPRKGGGTEAAGPDAPTKGKGKAQGGKLRGKGD